MIEIHMIDQARPVVREGVTNTYVKGPFYCVYLKDRVEKYPVAHIFRVVEPYDWPDE